MSRRKRRFQFEPLEGRLAPSGGLGGGRPVDTATNHGALVSEAAKTKAPDTATNHGGVVSEIAKTAQGGDASAGKTWWDM